MTSTGLALSRLLHRHPELVPAVIKPPVVDVARALLGEGLRLEVAGAVVSDRSRPFFTWHTHIDGLDESVRVRAARWPRVDRVRRLLTLLYLDDLDEDGGPLLVLPRAVGEPTGPLGPLDVHDWPGHVTLHPRPGTMVMLEQCTWHAALPLRRSGHRMLVGCYYAAAGEPPGAYADPRIAAVDSDDPVFMGLVGRGRPFEGARGASGR